MARGLSSCHGLTSFANLGLSFEHEPRVHLSTLIASGALIPWVQIIKAGSRLIVPSVLVKLI